MEMDRKVLLLAKVVELKQQLLKSMHNSKHDNINMLVVWRWRCTWYYFFAVGG